MPYMSEFEPFVPSQEFIDQKPFVIRGHHLTYYIILLRDLPFGKDSVIKQSNPAESAKSQRDFIESFRSGRAGCFIEGSEGTYDLVQKWMEYGQDILGSSKESADKYEERITETFERFVSLPDDYPAEITEQIPDAMCEACAVGEHCRSRNFLSMMPEEDMNTKDPEDLDEFLKNIKLLNLPEPVISYEQAYFSDAEPQKVKRVRTTIGVVKRVLREGNFSLWHFK